MHYMFYSGNVYDHRYRTGVAVAPARLGPGREAYAWESSGEHHVDFRNRPARRLRFRSARRDLPSHIEIEPRESGLDPPSYAKCEDVKSVSERRLIDRLGVVGPEPLVDIGRVLRYLLEL